jgi:hypothetical protein
VNQRNSLTPVEKPSTQTPIFPFQADGFNRRGSVAADSALPLFQTIFMIYAFYRAPAQGSRGPVFIKS